MSLTTNGISTDPIKPTRTLTSDFVEPSTTCPLGKARNSSDASSTIGISIANYDDNQHTDNENVRIGNILEGMITLAALMMH